MKLKGFIKRKNKYAIQRADKAAKGVPEGIYIQCPKCKGNIYRADLKEHLGVCPFCNYHHPLSSKARLKFTLDTGSFKEMDEGMEAINPLDFPGYEEKLENYQKKTGQKEAVVTGVGTIEGYKTVVVVMDSGFMMGSMGCIVGEKITRAIEYATSHRLPIIIFTASGGARMQEGLFSLMQMAKTSAALARHSKEGLLSVDVLTDPTMGGVTASFATLGDIILAEAGALVGFAGPRVIEQTIHQKLPEGFQRAEFLLAHGQIDNVIDRKDLRKTLGTILKLHE